MPMLLTEATINYTEKERKVFLNKLVRRNTTPHTTEDQKLFKKIWTHASAGSRK